MKSLLCLLTASVLFNSLAAQTEICITTDKTTSLVFPYPIKHVDRGTQAVLVQQVKDAPAILLVKAGVKAFSETNLSVITEDGSLYTFSVCYDERPQTLVHHLASQPNPTLNSRADAIRDNPKVLRGVNDDAWGVKAELQGIYVKENILFLHLLLQNKSTVNYTIDLLRLFIADKKRGRRTAVQETECKPVYIAGNTQEVKAGGEASIVLVLDKFTIPDSKYFGVQISEKSGGRHLSFKFGNSAIMKAKVIKE